MVSPIALALHRGHAALICAAVFAQFFYFKQNALAADRDGGQNHLIFTEQLIAGIASDWNDTAGSLYLFDRSGSVWKLVSGPWPVLFGRSGLAWGRGVASASGGPVKTEKDRRAPAGIFKIGKIYTYDAALPDGSDYPFRQLGRGDAWIDDPTHPDYNRHVIVDPENPPPWFEKQKMRHGDFAYRWLVEIRHNADPPVPEAGSAIFFHIRRGPSKPSAGCTTMAEADLVRLIRWLRAEKRPHYALLPAQEYRARWKAWGLPAPELVGMAD